MEQQVSTGLSVEEAFRNTLSLYMALMQSDYLMLKIQT